MAKTSGGVRALKIGSREYRKRENEIKDMMASGKYQSVKMSSGGGYVAIEKSTSKHKPEEIEAANILANKGYKVILKDEAGQIKSADGTIFLATFEQRTPTQSKFKKSLEHAKSKNTENQKIDIAVVYDKYRIYNKKDVEIGIKDYESQNKYRFKQIIVISNKGNVHKHRHNN